MSDKIKVSLEVLEGLETIRESGELNMFDYLGVMRLAQELRYKETDEWLQNNKDAYAQGIFKGFEEER